MAPLVGAREPHALLGRLPTLRSRARWLACPLAALADALRTRLDVYWAPVDVGSADDVRELFATAAALGFARFADVAARRGGADWVRSTTFVFRALLYRVHWASTSPTLEAQLVADSHLDLALYARLHDAYGDDELERGLAAGSQLQTPLELHYAPPGSDAAQARLAFAEGELPALAAALPLSALWARVGGAPRAAVATLPSAKAASAAGRRRAPPTDAERRDTALAALALVFFDMPLLTGRLAAAPLRAAVRRHPALLALLRQALGAALLGNFAHARARPPFARRVELRHALGPGGATSDAGLLAWVALNESTAAAAVREYAAAAVAAGAPLAAAVLVRSGPEGASGVTVLSQAAAGAAMDAVRRHVATAGGPRFAPEGTERPCAAAAALALASVAAATPVDVVGALAAAAHHGFAARRRAGGTSGAEGGCETSQAHFERAHGGAAAAAVARVRLAALRAHRLRRRPPFVDTSLLAALGVSAAGVALVRGVGGGLARGELSAAEVKRALAALNDGDFHALRLFLLWVEEWGHLQAYALPAPLAQAQLRALRMRARLEPWEPTPAAAAVYHLCLACDRWAHPVLASGGRAGATGASGCGAPVANPVQQYAHGHEKTVYDEATGALYCARSTRDAALRAAAAAARASTRAAATEAAVAVGVEVVLDAGDEPQPQPAAALGVPLEERTCATQPLRAVALLGRAVAVRGRRLWVLCTVCGGLTVWAAHRQLPTGGISCGHHADLLAASSATLAADASILPAAAAAAAASGGGAGGLGGAAAPPCGYCGAAVAGERVDVVVDVGAAEGDGAAAHLLRHLREGGALPAEGSTVRIGLCRQHYACAAALLDLAGGGDGVPVARQSALYERIAAVAAHRRVANASGAGARPSPMKY